MGQLWSSTKPKAPTGIPSAADAADATFRGTRPLRDASTEDYDWLIRHWLPHLHRLPQLLYESQHIAHGPVQYVCGSSFVGIVCAGDTPIDATLTATDPMEQNDVRISFVLLKALTQPHHQAEGTRAAPLGESPRAPDVTMTLNLRFSDGSSYHVSGRC